ncbi:membrane protein [Sphaerisporangium krabiense]|uniref:Cytoskeletal protein RodZ n=1 Tax=Sphaerisporangium krabiense TaxID=763782 RepID=A0A7W9DRL3_9ACTN|nr:helix-turn-helix domain-containing protein [Sphaerisporangium krabiense]MBB5628656.1 cytoskeletal protein RodZ [Sphaerisporangium krabiense]GII60503.1 membrane protein [Sphaerisporangium krabiense]
MSIGVTLAAARHAAGMTVAQLSGRTRIRETVIYAIERDDFSLCGGDFYARGHVRNIAKTLGLDPDAIVHQFDEEHGGVPRPVRAAAVFQAENSIKLRERRSPNWSTAMAIALAIVAVFGVARVMSGTGEPVAPDPKAGVPKAPAPSSKPSAAAKVAERGSDLVTLQVKATKPSWLEVSDSKGKQMFRGTLPAGRTSTWKARKEVRVTIGNAGGVDLEVNGKHIGVPGKLGQLVHKSFGPEEPGSR